MLRNEFFHQSKRNSDVKYYYRVKFFSDDVFNIKFESGDHSFEISLNDYSSLSQIPKEIRDNFKETKFLTCYIKLTGKGNFRCQAESDSLIFNSQDYLQNLLDGSIVNLIDSRQAYDYSNPKKHIDININLCDPKVTPFANAQKSNLYHIAGLRLLWSTTEVVILGCC